MSIGIVVCKWFVGVEYGFDWFWYGVFNLEVLDLNFFYCYLMDFSLVLLVLNLIFLCFVYMYNVYVILSYSVYFLSGGTFLVIFEREYCIVIEIVCLFEGGK